MSAQQGDLLKVSQMKLFPQIGSFIQFREVFFKASIKQQPVKCKATRSQQTNNASFRRVKSNAIERHAGFYLNTLSRIE